MNKCEHDRLDEDGICRNCGGDERGIGVPVPSGTQDEREREIRKLADEMALVNSGTVKYLLSLLDAERKRVQELEGALRDIREDVIGIAAELEKCPDCKHRWSLTRLAYCKERAESLLSKEQTK